MTPSREAPRADNDEAATPDRAFTLDGGQILLAPAAARKLARSDALETGAEAAARGRRAEGRALALLAGAIAAGNAPSWARAARAATPDEDRDGGCDVVVITDLAEIGLQVKSSERGVRHFRRGGRLQGPLRCADADPDQNVVARAWHVVGRLRAEVRDHLRNGGRVPGLTVPR